MREHVTCIMPIYNRFPFLGHLVGEAVESFLRQDYKDSTLLICNDTPGQEFHIQHPRIKVFNLEERFPFFCDKLDWMIRQAESDLICRWDDDDISLPNRISQCVENIGGRMEWRPSSYIYDDGRFHRIYGPGNSHVTGIFRKQVIDRFPEGKYALRMSGREDQYFVEQMERLGELNVTDIPDSEISYIYRWGTGSSHLSGKAGRDKYNPNQEHYEEIGERTIYNGVFFCPPAWKRNYVAMRQQLSEKPKKVADPLTFPNFFDYQSFYDEIAAMIPVPATLVEVGCYRGASLCYLAQKASKRGRVQLIGVDNGCGAECNVAPYSQTGDLLSNIKLAGVNDIVSLIVADSTQAASIFPNESVDFVYIDADHSYHAVRSDLQAWFPKVKPRGIIAGHDYDHKAVREAVDEFFEVGYRKKSYPDSRVWWHRKDAK